MNDRATDILEPKARPEPSRSQGQDQRHPRTKDKTRAIQTATSRTNQWRTGPEPSTKRRIRAISGPRAGQWQGPEASKKDKSRATTEMQDQSHTKISGRARAIPEARTWPEPPINAKARGEPFIRAGPEPPMKGRSRVLSSQGKAQSPEWRTGPDSSMKERTRFINEGKNRSHLIAGEGPAPSM